MEAENITLTNGIKTTIIACHIICFNLIELSFLSKQSLPLYCNMEICTNNKRKLFAPAQWCRESALRRVSQPANLGSSLEVGILEMPAFCAFTHSHEDIKWSALCLMLLSECTAIATTVNIHMAYWASIKVSGHKSDLKGMLLTFSLNFAIFICIGNVNFPIS